MVHLLVTSNRWHGINKNCHVQRKKIPEPCHKRPRTPPFCRELRRMLRGVISSRLDTQRNKQKTVAGAFSIIYFMQSPQDNANYLDN